MEAYSVAGEIGFSWWLVEHYSAYHVNCPDGCGLGEPTRGRSEIDNLMTQKIYKQIGIK